MPFQFDTIGVLDTGGTLAGSIVKKLRALGVASVLLSAARPDMDKSIKGAIIAGNGIVLKATEGALENILSMPVPILVLGANCEPVVRLFSGRTAENAFEKRAAHVEFLESRLFSSLSEGDRYFERLPDVSLGESMRATARAEGKVCAFEHTEKSIFGAFFDIEKNDPDGLSILENFARVISGCEFSWNMDGYLNIARESMQKMYPSGKVTVACSGGLLSAVTAVIANSALSDRAEAVMVDTGLLPEDEMETGRRAISDACGMKVSIIDAKGEIRAALKGVVKTREKRDIVYKTIRKALMSCGSSVLFASGTDEFSPVHGLFREEIRTLGKILGLPDAFLTRRPFPGAGMAVRISGEITEDKIECLRKADAIFESEIKNASIDKKLWQYYASLIEAENGAFIALHALLSSDSLNGYAYRLPYDVIERTVMRIMDETAFPEGIVYDVSGRMASFFSL